MIDFTSERWLAVPGFEGLYEVSDWGRVKSLPRKYCTGRILKAATLKSGYRKVVLSKQDRDTNFYVHRLVMAAFVGPCPPGQEVRHWDGNRGNNVVSNLLYGTRADNMDDQRRHGTHWRTGQAECINGHEFTEANTYINPGTGGRVCRICSRASKRKYKAKIKAAKN